jgi:hypothetical protein
MTFSAKDTRKIQRAVRQPRPCLLCGTYLPTYVGLFEPSKPEAWGGKTKKGRMLA